MNLDAPHPVPLNERPPDFGGDRRFGEHFYAAFDAMQPASAIAVSASSRMVVVAVTLVRLGCLRLQHLPITP